LINLYSKCKQCVFSALSSIKLTLSPLWQDYFDPIFLKLVAAMTNKEPGPEPALFDEVTIERKLAYSFPIFTPHFAR